MFLILLANCSTDHAPAFDPEGTAFDDLRPLKLLYFVLSQPEIGASNHIVVAAPRAIIRPVAITMLA